MVVYLFDYETGVYLGEQQLDATDCDPRAPQRMLIPGNATTVQPPRCGKGLLPCWRENQWVIYEVAPDPLEMDYYANL